MGLIHPGLAAAVAAHLPDTALITRPAVDTSPGVGDDEFGYDPLPDNPPDNTPTPVGSYACQLGSFHNRDGKPVMVQNGVEVVVPWKIVFFASDAHNVHKNDVVSVLSRSFKVIVPPLCGSFDVLGEAYCQEIV